ncbi:MAG: hypothetical protein ILNGONEN_00378 [Syntrophorhabdaceae bacterium]|nr:hypothetical protein [Syntrophorhabdaceae bacterium]
MNLQELSSGLPKDWLSINAHEIKADVISASQMISSSVPVQSWRAAKTSSWSALFSSVAETSLIQPPINGSLTITEPVSRGFTIDMAFISLYSSGAATTMTLRFKVNGTTILTSTIPVAVTLNQYLKVDYKLSVATNTNNRIIVSSVIYKNGVAPIVDATLNDVAWLPTGNNVLSVTGQFSDTDGTWVGTQWDMRSSCPQVF